MFDPLVNPQCQTIRIILEITTPSIIPLQLSSMLCYPRNHKNIFMELCDNIQLHSKTLNKEDKEYSYSKLETV